MVSPHFAKYNVGEDEDVMDYKSGLASNYTTKSVSLADAKNGSKEAKAPGGLAGTKTASLQGYRVTMWVDYAQVRR
ncbi:hypothetical protein FOMPIDRAFT_1051453 [Fomitopsis schrenkii]|uniref:Uncharacterized protein n=1 Tax=Fomitopsis schrenkii TaxID=2126942 RepID=S8F9X6_FOMSC|nr:hypothetical protein FOMPIDRAFT_1051453 [Fomitopsis schrenkii]